MEDKKSSASTYSVSKYPHLTDKREVIKSWQSSVSHMNLLNFIAHKTK